MKGDGTMRKRRSATSLTALASVLALGLGAPTSAGAQTNQPPPAAGAPVAPPSGEYAPPPSGAEASGSTYGAAAQKADRDYADQYARWAARYCVDQRNNTAAGALIGGVLGAVAGSSLAGHGAHAGGAVVGGALGAMAGAAIGASSAPAAACPPGYAVAAGAPAFAYVGPVYEPAVIYGPSWYQPWVWVDGRWVYRPYRYWYWDHRAYWRPDWRPGAWHYRYHRW
jgi:hypothetical protein